MTCSDKIKVFISDDYIFFPYNLVTKETDKNDNITIFVPTFQDEKVINKKRLTDKGFESVTVVKHVPHFQQDEENATGTVVYWNAISAITKLGEGVTRVFNVVLSDNLYICAHINIDRKMAETRCPFQVPYQKDMVCLSGEFAGDSQEIILAQNPNITSYFIKFSPETPLGIKILNIKRFLIILSTRKELVKLCVYLPYEELTSVHKELAWESIRRVLRGGVPSNCTVINQPSYQYVIDSLELLGIVNSDISSIHELQEKFNPLILQYKLVPDVIVQLNRINGQNKHVRLYCKHEAVAVTNAGPVPINLPTKNRTPFTYNKLMPPSEQFYQDVGSRDAFIRPPNYNYFL
ncbi:ODV-EC43 [Epinotia aporema granulovirus]|uniref:ODV-EC43 n=1 Tax=Epinotia aporema granulovirus TaxID=166056 RepID=K4ER60_9BBAC|nr:ODV-EC43 [Epinotia aporema granulovirus]AER41479.1 ODV-EC43 [Epinotia aporema granulovirus]